jgi:hypothetical protein
LGGGGGQPGGNVIFTVGKEYWLSPGMNSIKNGTPVAPAAVLAYEMSSSVCPLSLSVAYGVVNISHLSWHAYRINAGNTFVSGWPANLSLKVYAFCDVSGITGQPELGQVDDAALIQPGEGCGAADDLDITVGQLVPTGGIPATERLNLAVSFTPEQDITIAADALNISVSLYGVITTASPMI